LKHSTRRQKDRFIEAIERGMTVTDAAKYAGVGRTTPYRWQQEDPVFRRNWENVRLGRLQRLVDTAYDMALEGNVQLIKWLISRYEKTTQTQENQPAQLCIIHVPSVPSGEALSGAEGHVSSEAEGPEPGRESDGHPEPFIQLSPERNRRTCPERSRRIGTRP
jgi:hypothetical protein